MERTEPTEEKKEKEEKTSIAEQLDDLRGLVLDTRQDIINRLNKGFSDIKKILTDEKW